MRKQLGNRGQAVCAAVLCFSFFALGVYCVADRISGSASETALAAAGLMLPEGAMEVMKEGWPQGNSMGEEMETSSWISSGNQNASSYFSGGSLLSSTPGEMASLPGNLTDLPDGSVPVSITGSIQEMTISNTGVQYGDIWVKNGTTNHSVDIPAILEETPAVSLKRNGEPEILIYHTHTTEAYQGVTRTQDNSQNMVSIGEIIARELEEAGFGVIHDTTCHDYPSYNGSYTRSCETMQKNLEAYPGIQVTLDIHRDALGGETRLKPTAVVDGKKAAQVMIVSGCDDDGTLGFPNWEYNLRLGMRLQEALTKYPSLARPLYFCARKYNQHMTKGSLLIEVGTDMNTLEEAQYSGELLGKALAKVFGELTETA